MTFLSGMEGGDDMDAMMKKMMDGMKMGGSGGEMMSFGGDMGSMMSSGSKMMSSSSKSFSSSSSTMMSSSSSSTSSSKMIGGMSGMMGGGMQMPSMFDKMGAGVDFEELSTAGKKGFALNALDLYLYCCKKVSCIPNGMQKNISLSFNWLNF